jgi:hypothetical protein
MPEKPSLHSPSSGKRHWAVLVFLLGFMALVVFVSFYYLLPALKVYQHASHADRQRLRAWSTLLLAILLVMLLCGLVLTFRIGRFFFPRADHRRVHTRYVDVWAEAGKRFEAPEDSEEEEE